MNKRARNRLIGVTAIIVLAAIAIFASIGSSDGAYERTVDEVVGDAELIGQRVSVAGEVVPGSWDRKSNPMRFDIREEGKVGGPTLSVVYSGGVPSTFGDSVVATVKGDLGADGTIESDSMLIKCPSKYDTVTGSLTVDQALDADEGGTFPVSGFVVDGSINPVTEEVRFVFSTENGTVEMDVIWGGGLPAGMDGGSQVVVSGSVEGGQMIASDVALADTEE